MQIISKELKKIVEECKKIARDNGLSFRDETLEFITTNEDMIKLSPKGMIPTLYDYWVDDVFVLQDKGKYELYPHNPYETVINTRPPISFYNDNNPEWLNVMIFYHVIAHIDFFQNNIYFQKTWLDDFLSKAAADAQIIKELRQEKGRWVDYVIEFSRGIDNITNFFHHLKQPDAPVFKTPVQSQFDYFFDEYLQKVVKVDTFKFLEELRKYNEFARDHDENTAKTLFLIYAGKKYVDFYPKYEKRQKTKKSAPSDVMEYILENSPKLKKDENNWMKSVLQIVRDTAIYFQPQIRTKILNEGWASYWHEKLFIADERLRTHEVEFSKINSFVVSMPRVGLNPYAIGLRLFKYLEAKANRGMITYEFERIADFETRKKYDKKLNQGLDFIFNVRKFHSDSTALNEFVDQDFVNEYKLFVTGKRMNREKMVWEYYVKSRKAEDYRKFLNSVLYHPPNITVDVENTNKTEALHLIHHFEGKELVREYIPNTMLGIEFLWGNKVILDTHEIDDSEFRKEEKEDDDMGQEVAKEVEIKFKKVRYIMENRKISKESLS